MIQILPILKKIQFLCFSLILIHNEVCSSPTNRVTVNPNDIAKKIANSFAEKYAKDYAATIFQISTTNCNEKYKSLNGYYGVFASFDFNQNAIIPHFGAPNEQTYWAPLSIFHSDCLDAESNKVMTKFLNFESGAKDEYKYLVRPYLQSLTMKRGLEIYTPLNIKYLNSYIFDVDTVFIRKGERLIKLLFKDKSGACPKTIRISGNGFILYNETKNMVEKIYIADFVDYYGSLMYRTDAYSKSATKTILEVDYILYNNHLYTSKVQQTTQWIAPLDDTHYWINNLPSRPFPAKNKLIEYEYIKFANFVLLDETKKLYLQKEILHNGYVYTCNLPYNSKIWKNLMLAFENKKADISAFSSKEFGDLTINAINWNQLQTDLTINGRSLDEQGSRNANQMKYEALTSAQYEFAPVYHKKTKEMIYPMIYGKSYN